MEYGEVCVPNITAAERRQRLTVGIIALVVSLVIFVILVALNVSSGWRATLLLPLLVAAMGFFQWKDKTCVSHVARGVKSVGGVQEQIRDVLEMNIFKQQANKIFLKAGATAVAVTLLLVFLPI